MYFTNDGHVREALSTKYCFQGHVEELPVFRGPVGFAPRATWGSCLYGDHVGGMVRFCGHVEAWFLIWKSRGSVVVTWKAWRLM